MRSSALTSSSLLLKFRLASALDDFDGDVTSFSQLDLYHFPTKIVISTIFRHPAWLLGSFFSLLALVLARSEISNSSLSASCSGIQET